VVHEVSNLATRLADSLPIIRVTSTDVEACARAVTA